jgi:hypothetical protein
MEREGLREYQRRLREVAELRLQAERAAELERALAEISGREGELRKALIEAHDQLLRRDQELERLRGEAQGLRIRLDRILNSPPGRLYTALRRLPGLRAVERRRRAAIDAELAKHRGPSA